ncbi:MAG: putative Ig domain-containing protein, partial [Myxococcota bacterium]
MSKPSALPTLRPTTLLILVAMGTACGDDEPTMMAPMTEPMAEPLEIATSLLTDAREGEDYSAELIARGGTAPYQWTSIRLPAGLTLTETGILSGAPEAAGSFPVEIEVSDAEQQLARGTLSLGVTAMAPLPPVLEGPCSAPIALSLSAGAQTLTGRFPSALSTDGFCGAAGNRATVYFSLTIEAPAQLRAGIVSVADASFGRVEGGCPAVAPMSCGRTYSEVLPAGTYRFVAVGEPDADFDALIAKQSKLQDEIEAADGW